MGFVSGDNVLVEFSTFEDRFLGEVIAVTDSGDLVVSIAVPETILQRVESHSFAVVRYVAQGRLLDFASRVLAMHSGSVTMVTLKGPKSFCDAEVP
ncbi:hypothetical protein GO013_14285 [Pseudodesulfovibrio sp. JC047]|uniref:hypothetical protein n=1 Tax=Pseudodesulfovibrio sp. JC047 TaxID=2683199 RepID=UPI0013D7B256|nr:hypothetical protein [Pseudodesulfovibrio sp. JC047]NDV20576.1 hypothetical protein [Pseudodesulfovibrio sp. JC047]